MKKRKTDKSATTRQYNYKINKNFKTNVHHNYKIKQEINCVIYCLDMEAERAANAEKHGQYTINIVMYLLELGASKAHFPSRSRMTQAI